MEKSANTRIEVIDAIRGFAVLGILLANIQSWSGYKFLPFTELAELPYYTLDAVLYWWNTFLVDSKFYAIFSLLFGVGFGLQWERKQHQAETFLPMYRRRMAFLLLFGFLHMLLWSGDILLLYAILAFVMIALRSLSPRSQLLLGVTLMFAFLLTHLVVLLTGEPEVATGKLAHHNYPDMSGEAVIAAFASTDWGQIFEVNLHNIYWRWHDFIPNGRISRVLGFFLIGCYLARTGFFTGAARRPLTLLVCLVSGVALTLIAMNMGLSMASWARHPMDLVSKQLYVLGQLLMALGYMCVLVLAFETGIGRQLMHPLTLIGRTAFTSYLGQTVIGVGIFYGVGLGHIATLGLAQLGVLAIGIYAFQVVFASTWLRFFRQGPVEWAWRCLTAKKILPNRRKAP
ncbi:DUF418 domain-containing protein [Pseudohalioglobus lutimaris]|uniref:DUF418 domain-containing protein n=1 Tax=Pseudohalioglobus lutimaris TaxID=1737061 RepID=A0A2N5X876_9GAMM|nr:DUF418 domain-containing protein [Pseudohalioglobus lutimaris]PLW70690.1 hypothetical protein C0039_00725 [Pseudohalioglobus lutimaris]